MYTSQYTDRQTDDTPIINGKTNVTLCFRDNVYMGKKKKHTKPQPEHEKMLEHLLLQQTGHDCLNC